MNVVPMPRFTWTFMVLFPPTPFALKLSWNAPLSDTKVAPAEESKVEVSDADCPVEVAVRRTHCRPGVPGGRSLVSLAIVAPPVVPVLQLIVAAPPNVPSPTSDLRRMRQSPFAGIFVASVSLKL